MEIPQDVLGAVADLARGRSAYLANEASGYGADRFANLNAALRLVTPTPLTPDEGIALKQMLNPRDTAGQEYLMDARKYARGLFEDTPVNQIDIQSTWDRLGGNDERKLYQLKILLTAGVLSEIGKEEKNLDRYAMMGAESHTFKAQAEMFNRNLLAVLTDMGVDRINPDNPSTYIPVWGPEGARFKINDAYMGSTIDPKGFPKGVAYVLEHAERTRIGVADMVRGYGQGVPLLLETFKALKVATGAESGVAEAAMRAGLQGWHMQAIVNSYWEPFIRSAENYRRLDSGVWVFENVHERQMRISTQEAMDLYTGNKVEFKEKPEVIDTWVYPKRDIVDDQGKVIWERGKRFRHLSEAQIQTLDAGEVDEWRVRFEESWMTNEIRGKIREDAISVEQVRKNGRVYLVAFEDVRDGGGNVLIDKGVEFTLEDNWVTDEVRERMEAFGVERKHCDSDVLYLESLEDIEDGEGNVLLVRGREFTLEDAWVTDEVRDRIQDGTYLVRGLTKEGAPNPNEPEMLAWGEWLYTIEDIIREMDGSGPLMNYYLRSKGIQRERVIGHRTVSGLSLEENSILSWDDAIWLALPPERRSGLVTADLFAIKTSEFYGNAVKMYGIMQWDAFFDPACRAKQHLEPSMRAVIPAEYIRRHAITDIDTRDLTMSMFQALTGRKLNLNAYLYSMWQGADLANAGAEVPLVGTKRIDYMTDPYQVHDRLEFLGIVDFGTTNKAEIERIQKILEHYAIGRREYPGQYHDVSEINRVYYRAHYIASRYAKGYLTEAEYRAALDGMHDDMITAKRADYMLEEDEGGYYWDKRSPFQHPRPALEQMAMLGRMGRSERDMIKNVSHKNLIISLGGRADLPEWAYKGWYGKMLSLKYANSMGLFFYGEDAKMEQMQLKYMGVAGFAFKNTMDAANALIQSLDPSVLKRAGLDVRGGFKADDIGEAFAIDVANEILNKGFGVSGTETLRDYFKKLTESMTGYAGGSLSHLPGDVRKRIMLMLIRQMHRVVEGGVTVSWKRRVGLGAPGTEGELLRLDFDHPVFGDVDKWLAVALRERGDKVVFVEGEKPYISAQGQDVVYGLEGIIDPKASNGVGDWVRDDTPHMPLRERYKHRKLELFSTDILYRIMEEVMRDSAVFDVRDRQFVLDDIRASRVKIDSDYRKVIEGLVAKGELELVRREMQGKIDEFLGVEEEG